MARRFSRRNKRKRYGRRSRGAGAKRIGFRL